MEISTSKATIPRLYILGSDASATGGQEHVHIALPGPAGVGVARPETKTLPSIWRPFRLYRRGFGQ